MERPVDAVKRIFASTKDPFEAFGEADWADDNNITYEMWVVYHSLCVLEQTIITFPDTQTTYLGC